MKNHLIQVVTVAPGLKVGDVSHNAEQIISIIQSHAEAGRVIARTRTHLRHADFSGAYAE